jgi:FkbM family methyltransferase
MDCFIYESEEFRDELDSSPHHAGEVRFLRSIARPGMRVIEAGANTGVTAVALAKEIGDTGHLYAFEPVPEHYRTLMENLSRNGITNVSAYRLALSNRAERIRFYQRGGGSGITPSEDGETLWVEATTVTEFLVVQEIGRIDLINLDCEGSELLVLHGAKAVLEKDGPQIFCEIHHGYLKQLGQSSHDVMGYLSQFGYDVRPLQVEDLYAETDIDKCSHLHAAMPGPRAQPSRSEGERRA